MPKYVVATEVRDLEKPHALFVNSRGQVRFNAPSYAALELCNQPPTMHVAFEKLNDRLWACDMVAKGTAGCTVLQRAKNNKTAITSFGAVLADRPDLKVEPGRLRQIPWTVQEDRLILQLDHEENIPAPKRRPKKEKPLADVHPAQLNEV